MTCARHVHGLAPRRSKDHVVEVQKGDLVAGYVNQTAAKTAKKIAEAKGGILFVDEAYQLTQALMRGQSDFSGESIDEMMKCMLNAGRKSVTFIFAGYKKEMDEFITYNAGLESRIKCRLQLQRLGTHAWLTLARLLTRPSHFLQVPLPLRGLLGGRPGADR